MGHKVLYEAAAAGTELDADLASKATAEFDKAEAKIHAAPGRNCDGGHPGWIGLVQATAVKGVQQL